MMGKYAEVFTHGLYAENQIIKIGFWIDSAQEQ
jgi:hypothetical protein